MVDWGERMKKRKLSEEIIQFISISLMIGIFVFVVLYSLSMSIANVYLESHNIRLEEMQEVVLSNWVKSICFVAGIIIFISLFLFCFGEKIIYLISIIHGVEALQKNEMNFVIALEGNDELTELAQSINYLSKSQRELKEQEDKLKEERENLIRSLSHDIRTPLTSILAYSEYIKDKEEVSQEEIKSYIQLIQSKAQQIKILTDQLLNTKNEEYEFLKNGKLFIEQIAMEWKALLEDQFECQIDYKECDDFATFCSAQDLYRIFDNLASNVEKYAQPQELVELKVRTEDKKLVIIQRNRLRTTIPVAVESHNIGLKNVKQIAEKYGGEIEVAFEGGMFEIQISILIGI